MIQPTLRRLRLAGMLSMAVFATAAFAADHGHEVKVGKTGQMTLSETTQVGALTFAPGTYKFQHRVTGAQHFIHLTQMTSGHLYAGVATVVPVNVVDIVDVAYCSCRPDAVRNGGTAIARERTQ